MLKLSLKFYYKKAINNYQSSIIYYQLINYENTFSLVTIK